MPAFRHFMSWCRCCAATAEDKETDMFKMFLIKYAEIAIKGKNRYLFEDALVEQPCVKAGGGKL